MVKKNYDFAFTGPIILALGAVVALGLPLLVGGGAIAIKIATTLFSKPANTGIPVWAIFAVGIMFIYFMRRRRY
jgi:hypothetical protein